MAVTRTTKLLSVCLASTLLWSQGCGQRSDQSAAGSSASLSLARLSGTITIGGSSTMLPISRLIADGFQKANPAVKVTVQSSATAAGFKTFCGGGMDMTGASRPINAAEIQECAANRVELIELPVAFDSLSVVVNARNAFVDCLTVDELKRMWAPEAQGRVTRWNQIRSSFPDQPLTLFGPGPQSGTFDYFTLAIVGTEGQSRRDYTASDDYKVVADQAAQDPNGLAYLGFASYAANKDRLKLVSIDGGAGCVVPSAETVAENRYQPLSRPIFMYVNKASAARPEVNALAHAFVSPEQAQTVVSAGEMPLPIVVLLNAGRRLDRGVAGSVFGGRGSVLGVTADVLQEREKIRNELVR
jgi:phosphate transport system substrate-binding protein